MADCSDKNYRSMLHAYELGMLTDDERRDLEMHLLDCQSCREELQSLQETIRLMRQDDEIRKAIQEIGGEEAEAVIEKKPRRRLRPALVPTTVVALIVLFILIMKPWQIEIRPTQEAIAAKNRLAIMYFHNTPDPDDARHLGEILTNLLITDLAESHFMQVISHQHLYDLLRLMELEGVRSIDAQTATRIAQKAHANWMLMGNILQVEPQLIVTAQLVDVETGGVVASQRVTGDLDEDIFALVDKLSVEIKSDLSLPPAALQEIDRPVAEVTTHSPEAYQAYLEGLNVYYTFYWPGAREKFEEALTYDSTFAMAYYYLSHLGHSSYIDSAMKYSENASRKEQLYIKSRKKTIEGDNDGAIMVLKKMIERFPDEKLAWYLLGTFYYSLSQTDESIAHLNKAIEIDPLYKAAYNQLAYTHNRAGNLEKALEAINTYISLVPDEANPYDSRGEIYAANGKIEEAIASFEMALKKNPKFENSLVRLGLLYLYLRDYDQAEDYIQQYVSVKDTSRRAQYRYLLVYSPLFQGKFEEALQVLDNCIALMKKELGEEKEPCFWHLKAAIYGELGKREQAVAEQQKCMEVSSKLYPNSPQSYLDLYAQILAENGDYDKAEQIAESLKVIAREKSFVMADYWYALGTTELARGNLENAVTYLETADSIPSIISISIRYKLGLAYMASKQYEKAIKALDTLTTMKEGWSFYWGIWTVKTRYHLGLAHEQLGQTDQAIARYEEFLDIWKNADPGIQEIDDARQRLAQLKSKS